MSEDEIKAIEYLKNKIDENKKEIKNIESKNNTSLIGYGTLHDSYKLQNWFYLILLNLIEKLQKENKEKDKQIDLIAEYISNFDTDEDICKEQSDNNCDDINREVECKDCIKQYFEKKAKEGEKTC